jgi:hypothetical protein
MVVLSRWESRLGKPKILPETCPELLNSFFGGRSPETLGVKIFTCLQHSNILRPIYTYHRTQWRVFHAVLLQRLMQTHAVPYNYPNLSNRSTTTSPFTIVFAEAGSRGHIIHAHSKANGVVDVAASFINAVILSSVLSAGNHALFAGTRVLYSLSVTNQAPHFISRLNRRGVPYVALLLTASISGLCFGSSYVGSGQLWGWLQNLVGVSNQVIILHDCFKRSLLNSGKGRLAEYRNCKLSLPESLGKARQES